MTKIFLLDFLNIILVLYTLIKIKLNEPVNFLFLGLHWKRFVKSVKERTGEHDGNNHPFTASFNRIKPCPLNQEKEKKLSQSGMSMIIENSFLRV